MKNTKKMLLMSILSMILCVAMLLGTTFAWFTDNVTSGKNQIVAGNLDVELYHSSTGETDIASMEQVKSDTELFSVDLWEPGVISVENFTIANVGNLALKYRFNLEGWGYNTTEDGAYDLRDVIKIASVPQDLRIAVMQRQTEKWQKHSFPEKMITHSGHTKKQACFIRRIIFPVA